MKHLSEQQSPTPLLAEPKVHQAALKHYPQEWQRKLYSKIIKEKLKCLIVEYHIEGQDYNLWGVLHEIRTDSGTFFKMFSVFEKADCIEFCKVNQIPFTINNECHYMDFLLPGTYLVNRVGHLQEQPFFDRFRVIQQ